MFCHKKPSRSHSCYSWLFNLVSAFQYFAKLFLETIVKKNFKKKWSLKVYHILNFLHCLLLPQISTLFKGR